MKFSSLLIFALLTFHLYPRVVSAQVLSDLTLPINSLVTTQGNTQIITGGTRAGPNLFHSFTQFSLPTNNTIFFNNAIDIQNIITRVTGSSVSQIDGLIKTNHTANLFLINPHGIIFGANTQLKIGGSFLASTASSIKFSDETTFNANNPNQLSLLTVNLPIGLQFGSNPAPITVQGAGNQLKFSSTSELIDQTNRPVGLQVPFAQTLALVGGDISLVGGNLTAIAGRIELGSVGAGSYVNLTSTNPGWKLDYSGVQNWQNISLNSASSLNVSGMGAGNVQIQAKNLSLTDSSVIIADTTGNYPGGNLTVNVTDTIAIAGIASQTNLPSGFFSDVDPKATGNGANIVIKTGNLNLQEGGRMTANTFGIGNSGSCIIQASNINIIGNIENSSNATGLFADSKSGSSGNAGDLTINTTNLNIINGGRIGASTSDIGDGGNINIIATDTVNLEGISPDGQLRSNLFTANTGGKGKAGNLTIQTPDLTVKNGAIISAGTSGAGDGGDLTLLVSDTLKVIGTSTDGKTNSTIFTGNQGGSGNAGNLMINTPNLTIADKGILNAGTLGSGTGGNLDIVAGNLIAQNGAKINVSNLDINNLLSAGTGAAGNLKIQANFVSLDQSLFAAITAEGIKGNITINSPNIQLRHDSIVSASAGGKATGGNVTLDADNIVLLESSKITANAIEGQGGNISITTQGNFVSPDSKITASSQFGINGEVEIKTPDLDPSKGLIILPQKIVDISNQISQKCSSRKNNENKFILTGRGGLPSNPQEMLNSQAILSDWILGRKQENRISNNFRPNTSRLDPQPVKIIEADHWFINDKGRVELVASLPSSTIDHPWFNYPSCPSSEPLN